MSGDAETQRLIGTMSANIEAIMKKQDEMEKKLDAVVAMTNRWKGATTILIMLGGFIGWATNLIFKGHA
jgi:tetrahydromethanopterin S-methyltransferase subunit G